jgi:hypothetical protein
MVQITRTPEQTMMMEEERADFLMSGSSRPIYLKPGERQILIMDLAESRKFKPGFYYLSAYTLYKTNQTRAEIIRVSNMVVYVKID